MNSFELKPNTVLFSGERWNLDGGGLFTDPLEIIEIYSHEQIYPAFEKIEGYLQSGLYAAGFVSYEAAPAFDPAMETRSPGQFPLLWFGIYDAPSKPVIGNQLLCSDPQPAVWTLERREEEYLADVDTIRNRIGAGDYIQVNLTQRLRSQSSVDPIEISNRFMKNQPNAYHALISGSFGEIISASPELFFRQNGSEIEMKPMKGTMARGLFPEVDEINKTTLANSEKDKAENLMIVDLIRNDLGRIAETGSVEVSQMFAVERHPTIWQMTSTVRAKLREKSKLFEIFRALFPCGSVTGAPKIAAMKQIASLEVSPRSVYCGAIGWMGPGDIATFSVGIRTLVNPKGLGAEYGSGSGITFDSSPELELQELRDKTGILSTSVAEVELLETMRLENGEICLLDLHLDRLKRSAEYFGISISIEEVSNRLQEIAKEHPTGLHRLRMVASESGIQITESELVLSPITPEVILARSPIDVSDITLYHKTTSRRTYDNHRNEMGGAFDVLLWNDRHEITEFTYGNIVVEIDGDLYTPPIKSGLLAGCYRQKLLDVGTLKERVIYISDLDRADKLYFINSVRGMMPVTLKL